MIPKIQFIKDLKTVKLPELPEDTWVIYKEGYDIPDIPGIRGNIEFQEYKTIYHNIHANLLIFFGLNKIMTPSNRTDFVFEHLFTITRDIPKMSIDHLPFIGEPWRFWFHYGLCGTGKFAIPYSYTIETEWKHWFLRDKNNCRLDSDNIGFCITDTYSDIDMLSYKADFYDLNDVDLQWYDEVKEFVFNKYTSPKLWINNLLKMCNNKFGINYSIDSYKENEVYLLPELGVYKFLHEENIRRLNTFNKIIQVTKNENI